MSTSDKSLSKKKARPLRKLVFLAVLVGIVVAIKNALEDKGGSYEAPATAQPSTSAVPTPPVKIVTAEDIVERRPVENLDEFADPVEPASAAAADPKEEQPSEVEPAIAEAIAEAEDPDTLKETPGKIDPFGIR